jgi:hypothetical protein
MRQRGDRPSQQRLWPRSRSTKSRGHGSGSGAPTGATTGVFSTVGAEPRSSWTEPGDVVIPNPSVDPSTRSWVDPDAVPGVLGPPQANPTSHDEPPVAAPSNFAEALRAPQPDHRLVVGASSTGLLHRLGIDGQTGPIDLVRDPRTRLVGALVAVVVAVLLLGRLGDLVSPAGPAGPRMGVGSAAAEPPSGAAASTTPPDQQTPASADVDPQLVVIGVGGGLSAERVRRWEDVAAATDARFTFFTSITDLLGPVGIARYLPSGPGQKAPAPVAAGDDEARRQVGALVDALADRATAGHEVAAGLGPDDCPKDGADGWSAGDWSSELGQLRSVGAHPNQYNAWGDELPDLFAGGLNGAAARCADVADGTAASAAGPTALASALAEADLHWLVARPAATAQGAPPRQSLGLWHFSPAVDTSTANAGALEAELADGLAAAMTGDRAPFVVTVAGERAQSASSDAAVLSFVQDACGRSDVRCVTFSEAARQLEAQGPKVPG